MPKTKEIKMRENEEKFPRHMEKSFLIFDINSIVKGEMTMEWNWRKWKNISSNFEFHVECWNSFKTRWKAWGQIKRKTWTTFESNEIAQPTTTW